MALTAQQSQAWKLILEKQTYYATPIFEQALGNSHYEGELKANKTVNIVLPGKSTTSAYTGADISFSTPSTTNSQLTIDQMRYYADQITRDAQQGSIIDVLTIYARNAALQLMLDVDTYLAGLHTQIITSLYGLDAAPVTVGLNQVAGEVLPSRALSRLSRLITIANGDTSNLNVVVPPWFADALLIEIGAKLSQRGDQTSQYGVLAGKMEIVAGGFKGVYVSTQVAMVGANYKVMAGSPDSSLTVARAISEATTGEREANFASYVKGILLFAAKAPKEDNMALGTFAPGTDGNGNSLL